MASVSAPRALSSNISGSDSRSLSLAPLGAGDAALAEAFARRRATALRRVDHFSIPGRAPSSHNSHERASTQASSQPRAPSTLHGTNRDARGSPTPGAPQFKPRPPPLRTDSASPRPIAPHGAAAAAGVKPHHMLSQPQQQQQEQQWAQVRRVLPLPTGAAGRDSGPPAATAAPGEAASPNRVGIYRRASCPNPGAAASAANAVHIGPRPASSMGSLVPSPKRIAPPIVSHLAARAQSFTSTADVGSPAPVPPPPAVGLAKQPHIHPLLVRVMSSGKLRPNLFADIGIASSEDDDEDASADSANGDDNNSFAIAAAYKAGHLATQSGHGAGNQNAQGICGSCSSVGGNTSLHAIAAAEAQGYSESGPAAASIPQDPCRQSHASASSPVFASTFSSRRGPLVPPSHQLSSTVLSSQAATSSSARGAASPNASLSPQFLRALIMASSGSAAAAIDTMTDGPPLTVAAQPDATAVVAPAGPTIAADVASLVGRPGSRLGVGIAPGAAESSSGPSDASAGNLAPAAAAANGNGRGESMAIEFFPPPRDEEPHAFSSVAVIDAACVPDATQDREQALSAFVGGPAETHIACATALVPTPPVGVPPEHASEALPTLREEAFERRPSLASVRGSARANADTAALIQASPRATTALAVSARVAMPSDVVSNSAPRALRRRPDPVVPAPRRTTEHDATTVDAPCLLRSPKATSFHAAGAGHNCLALLHRHPHWFDVSDGDESNGSSSGGDTSGSDGGGGGSPQSRVGTNSGGLLDDAAADVARRVARHMRRQKRHWLRQREAEELSKSRRRGKPHDFDAP